MYHNIPQFFNIFYSEIALSNFQNSVLSVRGKWKILIGVRR